MGICLIIALTVCLDFGWKVKIAEVYRVKVGLGGSKFSHSSGHYSRIFARPLKMEPSSPVRSVFFKVD
jgi:hypothetical protein